MTSVVARMGWVCSSDAEEVEAGALRFEDGAAAYGADFDGGHGYGDLQVAVGAGRCWLVWVWGK